MSTRYQNKVSSKSPIGIAVIGKKEKDVVHVKTPKGILVEYSIVDIE